MSSPTIVCNFVQFANIPVTLLTFKPVTLAYSKFNKLEFDDSVKSYTIPFGNWCISVTTCPGAPQLAFL